MLSKAASKCALALLDVFFSKECLARYLATKEGKDLLDPDIIEGIRCKIQVVYMLLILFYRGFIVAVHTVHINYKYPCTIPEGEIERWGGIERIIKKINGNTKNRSRGN